MTFLSPDAEEMFILHRRASRNQTLGLVRRELLVEISVPAQLRQVHRGVLIESFMAYSLRPSPGGSKDSSSLRNARFEAIGQLGEISQACVIARRHPG